MISGKRTVWMSPDCIHREIRLAAVFPDMYYNKLKRYTWLHDAENPCCWDYYFSSISYMRELAKMYDRAFGISYRRRSEQLVLDIGHALYIGAKTSTADQFDYTDWSTSAHGSHLNPIKVELGTLYAIEDACHTLLSDPRTPLGANTMESSKEIHSIGLNSPDLDSWRFFDYQKMFDIIEQKHLVEAHKKFPFYFFKHLSESLHRQKMGDFLSTVSLLWILGHEDAHSYSGHILYFQNQLGAAADHDEPLFSELVAGLAERRNPQLRRYCEIEADSSACTRLVDHIVDSEMFGIVPFLHEHERYLNILFANSDLRPRQIAFVLLVRICISAALVATAVFERNVIKRNAIRTFYPNYIERAFHIITTSVLRATTSVVNNPHYGLEPLLPHQLPQLAFLITIDMAAIASNVLEGNSILQDSAMFTNDATEIKRMVNDDDFSTQLAYTLEWLFAQNDGYDTSLTKYGPVFREFFKSRVEAIRTSREEILKYQLLANPERKEKVYDSIRRDQLAEESLRSRIGL